MSDKVEAFDISSFLAGQVAEGELESEGRFTVSQDDAARKLARFSMPFDYAWVLKVVHDDRQITGFAFQASHGHAAFASGFSAAISSAHSWRLKVRRRFGLPSGRRP